MSFSMSESDISSHPGRLEQGRDRLQVTGDWILAHHGALKKQVAAWKQRQEAGPEVDLSGLAAVDTAGAALLVELIGAERLKRIGDLAPELPGAKQALLQTVAEAMASPLTPTQARVSPLISFLAQTGKHVEALWQQQRMLLSFIGLTLATLAATLPRPRRWRITSMVAHIQQTGLDAILIVSLLTFLIGAVVAFLGATVLVDFGATIYTVHLIAYAFLREFGVMLAAVLLAGRTASAFAAQIGSMKSNEEIDAIRTLGLSPVELLVLPRVLAMMVSLPILSFIGTMTGILGGAVVCALMLDISSTQFLAVFQRDITLRHFFIGLAKAPVFAFVIAVIGCLEGFKVTGSAQSLGEHTTSSVVQSIFMVILLDAIAAMFCMEMRW
ncbi:MAG: MlaE family lipid ABC transporter permease subunit [Desulfobacterales bacterium]|jgi:phospholipid/cholesterol/gamma-HCH transport system permease protein|nr:MlaE family lipid ABC transporter permease subunit [Desulfobacteraceae bacterium]MDY0313144.1 MlaE family lipid ABC transporter permease subunit [Desulfobacterales bacterium]